MKREKTLSIGRLRAIQILFQRGFQLKGDVVREFSLYINHYKPSSDLSGLYINHYKPSSDLSGLYINHYKPSSDLSGLKSTL